MPRPNILPEMDWSAVSPAAKDFDAWLAEGENEKHQDAMRASRRDQYLDPCAAGFLKGLKRPVHVIAMAEDWCPDVVRHVPIIQKMADNSEMLRVRYLKRADNLDVLVRFLTNGTESVPKFGFFNHEFAQCGLWGPMPAACAEVIRRGRAAGDLKTARQNVSAMYNGDPMRRAAVQELLACIEIASCESP